MDNKLTNEKLYAHTWDSSEILEARQLAGPILILGASGFIGAKLFFSLNQCRDDILGCSRDIKNNWRFRNRKWHNLENVDITNFQELRKLIARIRPKTIFNLSAYGGHSYQTDTEKIHFINYFGTLNILRILPNTQCRAFVQAGSSSEYGLNAAGPAEKDELMPNSDYAVSKIGVSYLIKYYGKVLGLPVMHLRLYSIYGPWEDRRRLMPLLVSNCQENKWPFFVDKKVSHDFVYVDDCANAFVKAALCLYKENGVGERVNIATGVKTTMENLADTAKKVFGVTGKPKFDSALNKKWDVPNWYGNPALASRILQWSYKTKLENGLKLLAEWEQEFGSRS